MNKETCEALKREGILTEQGFPWYRQRNYHFKGRVKTFEEKTIGRKSTYRLTMDINDSRLQDLGIVCYLDPESQYARDILNDYRSEKEVKLEGDYIRLTINHGFHGEISSNGRVYNVFSTVSLQGLNCEISLKK